VADNPADDLRDEAERGAHRAPALTVASDDPADGFSPTGTPRRTGSLPVRTEPHPDAVEVLAIGDVHGLYEPIIAALHETPYASAVLQVGDLTAGKPWRETHVDGNPAVVDALPVPFIWVHGNHEHWELFGARRTLDSASSTAAGTTVPWRSTARLPGTHLWPGTHAFVPGTAIGVVGLPGNYAPTWYNEPKPFPGDRCRHFNRDDVEAMARHPYPNVLLMHEAFRGQAPGRVGTMGIPVLARLVAELQPTVVLTGHHHLLAVARHGPTLAISLPPAWEGYAVLTFRRGGALIGWEFRHFGPTHGSVSVRSIEPLSRTTAQSAAPHQPVEAVAGTFAPKPVPARASRQSSARIGRAPLHPEGR
jgi:predicted phosphodiesterase